MIIKENMILNIINGQTLSIYAIKMIEIEEVIQYYLNISDITTAQKIIRSYNMEKTTYVIEEHLLKASKYADQELLNQLL